MSDAPGIAWDEAAAGGGAGLGIHVQTAPPVALLVLAGPLDATTAPTLDRLAATALGPGVEHVVVDCRRLRTCDEAAVASFVELRRFPHVVSVTLLRQPAALRQLLRSTRRDTWFEDDPPVPVPATWR